MKFTSFEGPGNPVSCRRECLKGLDRVRPYSGGKRVDAPPLWRWDVRKHSPPQTGKASGCVAVKRRFIWGNIAKWARRKKEERTILHTITYRKGKRKGNE